MRAIVEKIIEGLHRKSYYKWWDDCRKVGVSPRSFEDYILDGDGTASRIYKWAIDW